MMTLRVSQAKCLSRQGVEFCYLALNSSAMARTSSMLAAQGSGRRRISLLMRLSQEAWMPSAAGDSKWPVV
jgi:hypothetical protein